MEATALDLELLLKLRVVVARVGEMDLARWWNTKGQLSSKGTYALKRGFPRTHHFAQARSVFAVARHRCAERFHLPGSVNLFHLSEAHEEEFDARWEQWLDDAPAWAPFFNDVAGITGTDVFPELQRLDLVDAAAVSASGHLVSEAEGRAVRLPGSFTGSRLDLMILAAGFAKGAPGPEGLVVPFAVMGQG